MSDMKMQKINVCTRGAHGLKMVEGMRSLTTIFLQSMLVALVYTG